MLTNFFVKNLDIVYFVYGLSFFVMGIAILIQPRQESTFRLVDVIGILAGFGLSHGLNEWLDMFAIIRGCHSNLYELIRLIVLALSYIFLFEFGRRLTLLSLKKFLSESITVCLCLLALILVFTLNEERSIWPRYLLGLPGGLLSAFGFIRYYRNNENELRPIGVRRYFVIAAVLLGIYGILGGIIVPKADFFPASIINTAKFLNLFGVPVQTFRSLCAIGLAWTTWNILDIFKWESIQKLKETKERLQKLSHAVEQSPSTVMITDSKGNIEYVNPRFTQLTGYTPEEVFGKNPRILQSGKTPPEVYKDLWQTIASGREWHGEIYNKKKNGELFWESESISSLKDSEGNITNFILVAEDITDRKQAETKLETAYVELKKLQAQLIQSEKLAAIGELAAGVSHEIANPLNVISGRVKLISMEENLNEETKESLKIIRMQSEKINQTIDRLTKFARRDEPKQERININKLIDETLPLLEYQIRLENIKIVKDYTQGLTEISGDRNQLQEVFLNILLNAVQAMPDGGNITIKTSLERIAEYGIRNGRRKTDIFKIGDEVIVIEFIDTGPGIPKEYLDRIFEPFFTTKSQGTGLGLSVSYGIIEAHRGGIYVKSNVGEGTKFVVRLPKA